MLVGGGEFFSGFEPLTYSVDLDPEMWMGRSTFDVVLSVRGLVEL